MEVLPVCCLQQRLVKTQDCKEKKENTDFFLVVFNFSLNTCSV